MSPAIIGVVMLMPISCFKFIPYNYFKNTTVDRMGNPLNAAYLNTKEKLTEVGRTNIIGLQGALWGETLKSPQRLEYMLLPKLLGLAERAWAADPDWAVEPDSLKSAQLYTTAWNHFVNLISKRELPRLDYYAGGFNYRIPKPGATKQGDTMIMNSQLPGFIIRYTTDGSQPTANSPVYHTSIPYQPQIKMALFNGLGRSGSVIGGL
jgi:hexosaminidase